MSNELDVARLDCDEAYRQAMRWRMQTDLFFLMRDVLGYTKFSEQWHRQLADTFVKKDPNKPFEQQTRIRRRIILLPRKTYKTSANIGDTVQWIIGFPEIAIMTMTASNSPDSPLADAFVAEVASHFFCPDYMPRKPLHICFPEHVFTRLPKAGEFTSPARKQFRRDPTLKAVSIEQSLSGWHPDVIKSEDVQDNRNSQTSYALRKVRQNFYINIKMLGEQGLLDITGTRYGPMDLYGDMMSKAGEETLVLWKPAYIRKPHAIKLEDDELVEADVTLQFPEQLSWQFLREEKFLDPTSFWTQYMNVAEGSFKPTFPIDKLESAKVSTDFNDHIDKTHICWRFEYGDSKHAAAAVGIERNGRMTVVDVIRGQFTPTALARRVVALAKKWEARRVEIEDTPGARSMQTHIQNEALEADYRLDLVWGEFLMDQTAKALAIKSAEPLLLSGRLLFASDLAMMQETFRQLYQFGMVEESEIASVVTRVAKKLPMNIAASGFESSDDEAFQRIMAQDAYNRVYARAQYYEPPAAPAEEPEEEFQDDALGEMMPGLSG